MNISKTQNIILSVKNTDLIPISLIIVLANILPVYKPNFGYKLMNLFLIL